MRRRAVSTMIGGILVVLVALALIGGIVYIGVGIFSGIYREQQITNYLHYKDAEYLSMTINGSNLIVTNGGQYTSKITQIMVIPPSGAPSFINESVTIYPGESYNFSNLLQRPDRYAVLTSYGNEWYVPFDVNNPALDVYSLTITPTTGGTTSPAPGTYYYTYGQKVTISATPDTYYSWSGWVGAGQYNYTGPDQTATLYMWSNITETAIFNHIMATVTFSQIGLSPSASGTVLVVDGNSYSYSQLPVSFTWEEGTYHTFSWSSPVSGGSGEQFVWSSTSGLSSSQSGTLFITGPGSVTASYTTQYYLTMNAQYGLSVSPNSGWYNAGTQITISATGSSGSEFYSWSGTGSGSYSGSNNPATITMNGPITETANAQYYLNVYVNSGSGSVSGSGWYPAGSVATASETPATGYHFVDWTNGATGSTYSFTMNSPNSIGANFEINTYTVTFQSSPVEGAPVTVNGNGETTPYSIVVDYGTTISYSYGSSFSGGSGVRYVNPSPASGSFTVTSSTTITASYTTQYYFDVYVNSGSGSVSGGGWYDSGSLATASETPATGYHFVDWTDGVTSSTDTYIMNSPNSVGANFGINSYAVTFQSSPVEGAPVTVDGNSETTPYTIVVNYGTTVSYSYGSPFSGGSGVQYVDPSPASGSFTVTSSTTITADYTTQYYLTMNANPSSEGTVSPNSGWYNAGSQVTISADAYYSYYFSSWTGSGSGSYSGSNNPATITMNSPITETANFAEAAEVSYNSQDYGTNVPVSSTAYLYGDGTSTSIDYSSSWGAPPAWLPPGTYTISYSTDQYGASVYSAPGSITVSQGGIYSFTATYYTPTSISLTATQTLNLFDFSGTLTAADGSGLSGQSIVVYWQGYRNGLPANSGYLYPVTGNGGAFGFSVVGLNEGTDGATATVTFYSYAGYLGSSATASAGYT